MHGCDSSYASCEQSEVVLLLSSAATLASPALSAEDAGDERTDVDAVAGGDSSGGAA